MSSMTRKVAWVMMIIAVLFFGVAAWVLYQSWQEPVVISTTTDVTVEPGSGEGRYIDYTTEMFSDERYTTTILFFARPGSEESDAFDGVLANSYIPLGLQIARIDVDANSALTTEYEVTIPPTFVRITADGAAQTTWQAYGQTKTVDAIIEHTM